MDGLIQLLFIWVESNITTKRPLFSHLLLIDLHKSIYRIQNFSFTAFNFSHPLLVYRIQFSGTAILILRKKWTICLLRSFLSTSLSGPAHDPLFEDIIKFSHFYSQEYNSGWFGLKLSVRMKLMWCTILTWIDNFVVPLAMN